MSTEKQALHQIELRTMDKIVHILKEKKISQKNFCAAIDISPQNFSEWKAGRNRSYMKKLPIIADFLEVSVTSLIDDSTSAVAGEDELVDYLEELKARPEMRMLFKLAKGATKQDVEDAVRIIEALRRRNDE